MTQSKTVGGGTPAASDKPAPLGGGAGLGDLLGGRSSTLDRASARSQHTGCGGSTVARLLHDFLAEIVTRLFRTFHGGQSFLSHPASAGWLYCLCCPGGSQVSLPVVFSVAAKPAARPTLARPGVGASIGGRRLNPKPPVKPRVKNRWVPIDSAADRHRQGQGVV